MNVMVIGSGGREHALCHALARSKRLGKLYVLPGNAGTESLGVNVPGDPCDVRHALTVARRERIDLTIVGPEDPLAAGIVDAFEDAGLRIFGPRRHAAMLESDKAYAKQLMRQHAVPTAEARVFDDIEQAHTYISTRDHAMVVKAAGLAKGKGVIVCADPAETLLAAERILVQRAFGDAGRTIVVEERLEGREISLMAIVDGHTMYLLEPAQDYKRLLDGDRGPNTGGMGSYSPARLIDEATLRQIQQQIFIPTLDALVRDGVHYRGVLYAGLMLTAAGPKVLEFNCRFGDPETQVLMLRLESDLLELLDATVSGRLDQCTIRWRDEAAVCVVLASAGYPEKSSAPTPIIGLPDVVAEREAVFHSATARQARRIITAGGRVLGVTALGATVADARTRAYEIAAGISFDGMQLRRDIAAGV